MFTNYKQYVAADEAASYDALLASYDGIKYEIARIMGFSALGSKEAAYEITNGILADYVEAMEGYIDTMIAVGVAALLLSLYVVVWAVLRPIGSISRKIKGIVKSIEDGEGDLTQRIAVKSNDEISDLAGAMNVFMERLQESILPEFGNFVDNSVQYQENATYIQRSMTEFTEMTEDLRREIQPLPLRLKMVPTV